MGNLPDPNHPAFSFSSMARFLDHFVNLTSLSTQGTDIIHPFLRNTYIRNAKCFGHHLSELNIKPRFHNKFPFDCSIELAMLYFQYPLRHLAIDTCSAGMKSLRAPSRFHVEIDAPMLDSLILTRTTVHIVDLEYLLKQSLASLRTLVLDIHPGSFLITDPNGFATNTAQPRPCYVARNPPLVVFMETISPALERLELYWDCGTQFPLSDVVSRFPNLRRLGWGGPLSASGGWVLSHLPLTLEELVIERCPAVTSDHIVALLDGGTSNLYPHGVQKPYKLKEIEVGPGMGWTDAGWESVRAACKREGVLVGFARTHSGFKPHPAVKDFRRP